MAKPSVATKVHETLDVHVALSAKVTLYLNAATLEDVADPPDLAFINLVRALVRGNVRLAQDLVGSLATDSVDISKCDFHPLVTGKIDSCNSCHRVLPLTLTLLVTRDFANDAKDTRALDNLALGTNLFN